MTVWLAKHRRLHMHFMPTYYQVERLFAEATRDFLQCSDHRSGQAPDIDLRRWLPAWNENPKPFICTKTAAQILESLGRLLQHINGGGYYRRACGGTAGRISGELVDAERIGPAPAARLGIGALTRPIRPRRRGSRRAGTSAVARRATRRAR